MKNKLKIALAIMVFVVLLSSTVALAYYVKENTSSIPNQEVNISDENIIEISSFQALIEKGTSSEFNDYNKISNSSTRSILRLTKDIILSDSVILTNDVHIDLNSKTLNLNDHELIFKHGYSGCFMLYNGTIHSGKNASGKIIIDLPNAGYKVDNLTYKKNANDTTSTEAEIVKVLNIDPIYTAYSALYLAANCFASDLNSRIDFKTFDEIKAIKSFSPELFIDNKNCSYNSNTSEACSFVYKDLDLIDHYLSTDIKISYSSSNDDIINSYGELGGTFGDVNFTITISKEGWENSYSCTFLLHVVDLSQEEVRQNVGLALIKEYLSEYLINEDLVIKEEVILSGYYYKFEHAINLPKTALGQYSEKEDGTKELINAITYSYSTTDINNKTRSSSIILENENSNAYVFAPSLSDYHLVVTIDGLDTSLNMYSTYVNLDETIAYYIANNLYGGSIIYDKALQEKKLITYSDITSENYPDLKNYLDIYNVTNITYSIKNDSEVSSNYELNNDILTVKSGSLPSDKEGYITMTIHFGETNSYDIDLFVEYLDANGTTLSSYLTYYSIYNSLVPSELETSFILPFCENNLAPYTCYDVALYETEVVNIEENIYTKIIPSLFKPDNLKIELWYDDECKLVFVKYDSNTPESFTKQLDAHLAANSLTLQDLALKDAYYKFSIDAQNSLTENTKLVILYNYKFNASDASWTRYENTLDQARLTDNNTTYLTVLGGLFYNTNGTNSSGIVVDNAVVSPDFFVWIYNKFRPTTTEYSDIGSASNDKIIPIDWLGQIATITKDDTGLANVTNFSGIKYLTGITEADLSDSTISENVLTAISEMKSIKELNLSKCNLTSVESLSKLSKQNTLKILDISNNNVQYFESITAITSLEKVYLYGNYSSHDYYGSKGICNFQAFADLMMNGCSVYNDISNGVPVLYAESNNLDDYRRLKEIAYQSTLKDGSDIINLYSQFAALGTTVTNVTGNNRPGNNPFGLQTAGTLAWGYEGDTNDGAKYHAAEVTAGATIPSNTYYELINGVYEVTSDTKFDSKKTYYVKVDNSNATYFYVTLTYNSGYVLKVKYYVDRF